MKPYDRQRPGRVSTEMPRDSPTVQMHCTQSIMLAGPATTNSKPNGTHRNSSVRPDSVTRRYNTNLSRPPSPRTFQPVRTLVDAFQRKPPPAQLHSNTSELLAMTKTEPEGRAYTLSFCCCCCCCCSSSSFSSLPPPHQASELLAIAELNPRPSTLNPKPQTLKLLAIAELSGGVERDFLLLLSNH